MFKRGKSNIDPAVQIAYNAIFSVINILDKENVVKEITVGGKVAHSCSEAINLPLITNGNKEVQNAITGYGLHEMCHHLYTDFSVASQATSAFEKDLLNAIEDGRIEHRFLQSNPGAAYYLDATAAYMLRNQHYRVPQANDLTNLCLAYAIFFLECIYVGQFCLKDIFKQTEKALIKTVGIDLVKEVTAILQQVSNCRNTQDALKLSTQIANLFKQNLIKKQQDVNQRRANSSKQDKNQDVNQSQGTSQTTTQLGQKDFLDNYVKVKQGFDALANELQQLNSTKDSQISVSTKFSTDVYQAFKNSKIRQNLFNTRKQMADLLGNGISSRLQTMLQSQNRSKTCFAERGRKLSQHRLGYAATSTRLYEVKTSQHRVSAHIELLLDMSGSMHDEKSDYAISACYALFTALKTMRNVSINVSFFPFRRADNEHFMVHRVLTQSMTFSQTALSYLPNSLTPLGQAVSFANQSFSQMRCGNKRKVLIVITDGEPDDKKFAAAAIEASIQQGVAVYGIGIFKDPNEAHLKERLRQKIEELVSYFPNYAVFSTEELAEKGLYPLIEQLLICKQ